MKKQRILQLGVVCAVLAGVSANAALIGLIKPTTSDPYYCDFTANSLLVNYSYDSGTGIGTLTAQNTGAAADTYESGANSAGTGSSSSLHQPTGFNAQSFSGTYSLTAHIEDINNVWSVIDGSFAIKGQLTGVTSSTTSLLLKGNLIAGGDGPSGTWGYSNGSKEFEFLYTVNTWNSANGAATILADYNTDNPTGSTIEGGIILNVNKIFNGLTSYTTTSPFSTTGYADTFVPEPESFGWTAAGIAGLGLICLRRKSANQTRH